MLPNFLVVGAQKSGTTSLHEYLRAHPAIYLPEQKETKFFVNNAIYDKGLTYYEQTFFASWCGEVAVGEVDPDYMFFPSALERICQHLSHEEAKFIFIFRNPVERAYSHYLMTFRRNLETLSFEEALEAEADRLATAEDFNLMHYSYFSRGLYSKQVERFLQRINRKQMLFLLAEDLSRDTQQVVNRCVEFLGLDPSMMGREASAKRFHAATVPRHTGLLRLIKSDGWYKKVIRKMIPLEGPRHRLRAALLSLNEKSAEDLSVAPATRSRLMQLYSEDMVILEQQTGLNLECWRQLDG